MVVAFEAGRDGFWLARWLRARGIEAYVIHATSIPVSREHRRAKTDRLDTGLLMRAVLGWLRGEPKHCHMVAIPTACRCSWRMRRHRDGPVALLARNREHRGDETQVLARAPVLADNQRFELVEFLLRRVVAREPQGSLEIVDDRVEGAVDEVGRTLEAQARRALRLETPAQLAQDAALADARLAGQQHHLAFALLGQT